MCVFLFCCFVCFTTTNYFFYYNCTKARIREATRINFEISRPAAELLTFVKVPVEVEAVAGEVAEEPEATEETVGVTGAAEIVMGILTFV